ncbi:phage tail protein [Pseudomonas putida]|uniref:phage tail protein n=1 Tax=Pseudomonas putida TaxID=303 RepID=UPI003D95C10D
MPWYKSGTVACTLNSTTVTGTGTAFAANARVGDAFLGPDGRWYEVANIASDTVLSILPAYLGATVSAGTYALAPMQGYVKDSADALRALVNQYGAKLAALGTTGNYDILPVNKGGTGGTDQASARSGLGLGSVAIESVVPVIKGGTGGTDQASARAGLGLGSVATESTVPVDKGGTGGTTQAAARTGLGLGAAAVAPIVGAVYQSGGVPTGAIVETGTNAAGTYTKYADGTLICRSSPGAIDQNVANTAYATIFGLPAVFVGAYTVVANVSAINVNNVFSGCCRTVQTTATTYQIIQAWSVVQTYTYTIIAIGRWF